VKNIFLRKHEQLLKHPGFLFVLSIAMELLIRLYEHLTDIPFYERQFIEALAYFLEKESPANSFHRNWTLAVVYGILGRKLQSRVFKKLCCITYPANDAWVHPFATSIFPDKSLLLLDNIELDAHLSNYGDAGREYLVRSKQSIDKRHIRIIVGADSTYFCAFAYRFAAQHSSLKLPINICFHVVNPNEQARLLAKRIQEDFAQYIRCITSSTITGADAGYFASSRFLEAVNLYKEDDTPLLITDIDFMIKPQITANRYRKALQTLAEQANGSLMNMSIYQNLDHRKYYPWSRYAAGCIYMMEPSSNRVMSSFRNENIGYIFLRVFKYLFYSTHPLFRGQGYPQANAPSWFIDQNVLAATIDVFEEGIKDYAEDDIVNMKLFGDSKVFMHGIYCQDNNDKALRIAKVQEGVVSPDLL
jgi:hypothetical protein